MRSSMLSLCFLLLGITTPALGGDCPPQVCGSLATMLKRGYGNTTRYEAHQTLLSTLARNARGRLTLAPWDTHGGQRASYLRAAGALSELGFARTATASAGQLVAVMTDQGSASCGSVLLFRSIGGRLIRIMPPYVTQIVTCKRYGDRLFLGSLDGRVLVARETNGDTDLEIAPWNGHEWGPICSVVVKYVPKLIPEGSLCHLADCAEAEIAAKRIAAKIQPAGSIDYPYQEGSDRKLDHLVELAGRTLGTDAIPFSSSWDEPKYTPQALTPYMAKVGGRPTLAIAGEWKDSPAMDSPPIGYAVALWQESDDKLILIAAFHLLAAHSAVKSVLVTR